MRLTDPFKPVHQSVEELVGKAKSTGAKIELIDMLIGHLQQAKENLRKQEQTNENTLTD